MGRSLLDQVLGRKQEQSCIVRKPKGWPKHSSTPEYCCGTRFLHRDPIFRQTALGEGNYSCVLLLHQGEKCTHTHGKSGVSHSQEKPTVPPSRSAPSSKSLSNTQVFSQLQVVLALLWSDLHVFLLWSSCLFTCLITWEPDERRKSQIQKSQDGEPRIFSSKLLGWKICQDGI